MVLGLGKLGHELVRAVVAHPRAELVAVVTSRPEAAKDVPPGTRVLVGLDETDLHEGAWVLSGHHAEGEELVHHLVQCAELGFDVVTSSGLFHPGPMPDERWAAADGRLRHLGRRALAAGLNPGFLMDVLVGQLLTCCPGWEAATVRKPSNPRAWPASTRELLGIGVPGEEFAGAVRAPLAESARVVAAILGVGIAGLTESISPLLAPGVASVAGAVIPAGASIGFVHECLAVLETGARLSLVWDVSLDHPAGAGALELQVDGGTSLNCTVGGAFTVDPYPATASRMLQGALVGRRLAPGLHSLAQVPAGA